MDPADATLDAAAAAEAEAAAAEAATAELADPTISGPPPAPTGDAPPAALPPEPAPGPPEPAGDAPPSAGDGPPPVPPAPPRGPAGASPPPPRPPKPLGLRDQAQRTFEAGRALVNAHVVLAKAELAAIAADLKVVVAQVGAALALLLYIGLLVPVGTALFLGEWLFGSMGWGILHGALFSIAMAVVLVLSALRISRTYLVGTLFAAILVGTAVAIVFGLAWPNAVYAAIGENVMPTIDPAYRPLLVAIAIWGAVMAFLGIIGGARAGGVGGAIGGFFGGAIVGFFIGAFTAISFSLQVGVALGVTVALVTWPILAALRLRGYDWEDLQRRFTPQASIDAAMETKAFVEARLPGRKGDEEDAS
jgi:hypothetical protein